VRVLVVDDEPLARRRLIRMLAKLPDVVAHEYEPVSNTARLRILLLGSTAVVRAIRSTAGTA